MIRFGYAAALPSFSWPRWREGRAGCAEAPMVTVGVIAGVVERRLAAGRLRCPGCSGRLAGWGHARERVIRGQGGIGWRLRPRRSRCQGCGVTHVLLPVSCLLRRADGAAVIWAGLTASAAGAGHRKIAAGLGSPASTVLCVPRGRPRHSTAGPAAALPRQPRQLGSRTDRRADGDPARRDVRQHRSGRLDRDNAEHRRADGARRHCLPGRHGDRPG